MSRCSHYPFVLALPFISFSARDDYTRLRLRSPSHYECALPPMMCAELWCTLTPIVPSRANIAALKHLGVHAILAFSPSVPSVKKSPPATLPSQPRSSIAPKATVQSVFLRKDAGLCCIETSVSYVWRARNFLRVHDVSRVGRGLDQPECLARGEAGTQVRAWVRRFFS